MKKRNKTVMIKFKHRNHDRPVAAHVARHCAEHGLSIANPGQAVVLDLIRIKDNRKNRLVKATVRLLHKKKKINKK